MRKLTLVGATASTIFVVTCLIATPLFAQENPSTQSNIGSGPSGVHNLRVETGPNPGQVVLSWTNAYPDVTNYNLLYGTAPGSFQYGAVNIGKVTSYTVNYLTPGQTYYFAISPIRSGKAQFVSLQVSSLPKEGAVTPPPTPPTPTAPTASLTTVPKNDLAVTQDTAVINNQATGLHNLTAKKGDKPGQVSLSWNQAYSNVDNYSIVYGTEPGKFQYGALNVGKTNSYTISNLTPGTKYYFALVPAKGGKSVYITSQVSEDPTPGVIEVPAVATATPTTVPTTTATADTYTVQDPATISPKATGAHQLKVTKNGSGEVTLNWQQAYSDTENYDVVYGTEPGKFQYGALNVGKTNSYTVKGLDPDKHYYFAIAPVKGGKAQYITQQVSDTAAPVVPSTTTTTSTGTVQPGTPGTSSGGTGTTTVPGTGGTVTAPPSVQQPTGKKTSQPPTKGGKETDRSPAKSVSQPSEKGFIQNLFKPETKKDEKPKVKGVSTYLSPLNGLVDWLKKFFLR